MSSPSCVFLSLLLIAAVVDVSNANAQSPSHKQAEEIVPSNLQELLARSEDFPPELDIEMEAISELRLSGKAGIKTILQCVSSETKMVQRRVLSALMNLGLESTAELQEQIAPFLDHSSRVIRYAAALAVFQTDPLHRNERLREKALRAFESRDGDIAFDEKEADHVYLAFILLGQMLKFHHDVGFNQSEINIIFSETGIYGDELLCDLFLDAHYHYTLCNIAGSSGSGTERYFRHMRCLYDQLPLEHLEGMLNLALFTMSNNDCLTDWWISCMLHAYSIRTGDIYAILNSGVYQNSDDLVEDIMSVFEKHPEQKRELFVKLNNIEFHKLHRTPLYVALLPDDITREEWIIVRKNINAISEQMAALSNKSYAKDKLSTIEYRIQASFDDPSETLAVRYCGLIAMLRNEEEWVQERLETLLHEYPKKMLDIFVGYGWTDNSLTVEEIYRFIEAIDDHEWLAETLMDYMDENKNEAGMASKVARCLCITNPDVIPIFESMLNNEVTTTKFSRFRVAKALMSANYSSRVACQTLLESQDIFDYCSQHQGTASDTLKKSGAVSIPFLRKGVLHQDEKIRKESERALKDNPALDIYLMGFVWMLAKEAEKEQATAEE